MQRSHHNQRGFTIIEVMIVLVIVALIILIVFLAVPAVQRMNRNNSRRNAANFIAAELGSWASAHTNRLPGELGGATEKQEQCAFIIGESGGSLGTAPSGVNCNAPGGLNNATKDCILVQLSLYSVCFHDTDSSPHTYIGPLDEISIQLGHWCGLSSSTHDYPITAGQSASHSNKYFAVWTAIELGTPYCIDNHDGDE